ncbi:hypothetical protein C0989_007403, partial [Termitomyces sp. Mn162]
ASIKELELKGFVEVIALEVELTADKGTGGTTVDKGGEYLGQAVESDIDDKQLHRPGAELQGSLGMLANPDTPLEALALQDEAWTCLLHLETQVQLMQSSLTHYTTKLSTLCQTMDLISQSLQALLECLSPNSTPPTAEEPAPPATAPTPVAPVTLWPWIPCPALPDAYNGAHSGREQFLQFCLTYIHHSRDAFDSDALKIAWYKQGKRTLDEYIDLFQALVEQATYSDSLQLCLSFWDGLHPALVEHIDNLAEDDSNDEKIVSWYEVAQDQWQLMEIWRELHCPHSMMHPIPVSNFHHPTPTHPAPALAPAASTTCPLPWGFSWMWTQPDNSAWEEHFLIYNHRNPFRGPGSF